MMYSIAALIAFTLGFTSNCIQTGDCTPAVKYKSHIVKTANFIPSYERDWRERYRV